jgi:hypothetical protein
MMNFWPVLNYEIQMYFGARHLQGYPIKGADHNIITLQTSAMTEVKALHIRILVDMFLERKQKDDINIDDILPDWREKNETVAHNLDNAYNKKLKLGETPRWYLNKYLVHPDKRRGDHFDWTPIIKRMDTPLKNVFKTLPIEKLEALKFFQKYLLI